jgi:TolA-binding protein
MQFYSIKFLKKFLFIIPAILLVGCSIWGDFTTYFNLYYNTSDIFSQAEDAIKSQKTDLFSNEEVTIPGSATQLLNKVIEKASQILQFHSQSAYVDDALLMLGKSFFYQKNYLKAIREFQELVATQPNSNLILEAKLWIGKSDMKLKNYDDALSTLEKVRKQGIDEGKHDIVVDSYIEEIKYKLTQQDYSGAITLSKELLTVSKNDEINAEVVYEMGKLYNLLNDPQNAILAFQQVLDYSPSYDIEFNARLELGKAYREAGQPEKALNIFDDMSSRKNYSEFYDQIDLELGTTQVDLKNYKEAYNYFKTVDTGFTNSKSAGIAKYKLGELYQYYFFNFDSASYYYSKSVTSRLPEEFILSANDKIQKFRKYKTLSDNISQNYKKLEYVENPESFVKDSIAYYSDTVKTENPVSTETNISSDNRRGRFNDRRFSEMSKSEIQASNTTAQKTGKGIPPIRPNISADSIKSLLVQNLFELGNLFFTEFNLPDSAYYYYSKVLNDYPDSKYQARTMYALGSYYLTINENAKADSLFNIIYDNYKNENVVNAAANKLNKPLIDLNYDPAVSLYDSAEKRLTNKNYTASLKEFYNIYKSYPQSTLAPKALYATGWILENQLNMPDSAALFYDTLTARYPKTVYAVKISKGIDFYNQEKARIKKAYEDSLALVKKARLDSLRADSLRVAKSISVGKASYDSVKTENPDSLHKNNNKIPLLPGKEEKLKGIDTSQKSRKTLVP